MLGLIINVFVETTDYDEVDVHRAHASKIDILDIHCCQKGLDRSSHDTGRYTKRVEESQKSLTPSQIHDQKTRDTQLQDEG